MNMETLQERINNRADNALDRDIEAVFRPFKRMFGTELYDVVIPASEGRGQVNGHGVVEAIRNKFREKATNIYREREAAAFLAEVAELKDRVASLEGAVQP